MVGIRCGLACASFFLAAVLYAGSGTAMAQTVINQTSCSPLASCQTGGFLQSLTVNCGAGERISTALASLADRDGPNLITISGICNLEAVNIVGFNRLTIQSIGGASIQRAVTLVNSRNVLLKFMLMNFATAPGGAGLILTDSNVMLDQVTVTGAGSNNGITLHGSGLSFQGAPSLITGNNGYGILALGGSQVNLGNVTISNNGEMGVEIRGSSTLNLVNQVNGVPVNVDVSGNAEGGIGIFGGSLTSAGMTGTGLVRIHHNGDAGLIAAGVTDVHGNVQIDSNTGDQDFGFGQVAVFSGIAVFEGTTIHGGMGAFGNATVFLGSGSPMTLTGGAQFLGGSFGLVTGTASIDALACDNTSWVTVFPGSTIGTNTCPNDGPAGTQGPAGPAGPPGPAGSANGTLGFFGKFTDSTTVGNSVMFQSAGGRVGVSTTSPLAPFHSVAAESPGTFFDVFSNSLGALPVVFRAARGTPAAPAPVQTHDILGGLAVRGYAPSGFTPGKGQVMFKAAENWTDTANGTYLQFTTTPIGQTAFAERMRIDATGRIGIGTPAPAALLHVAGNAVIDGTITALHQDVAEWVESGAPLEPGTVVVVDPAAIDGVRVSSRAYDTAVSGAISEQPGVALGIPGSTKSLVAQSGRVRIKVDARFGAIRAGDLLVTSPTPGHAMVAKPGKVKPGTILGKALEPLARGQGDILALLTLQ